LTARVRKALLVGVVAAFVASLMVGTSSASAASSSLHRMNVNPEMTPVPNDGADTYGLRTCQTQQTAFGACYDPYQMRHAYGVDSLIANGYDGTGKTIVILDASDDPFLQSNFNPFNAMYGLPNQTITQVYPDGVPPYDPGWSQEMQLDVDWSHAIAPGAKIVLVHGIDNSDQGLISALNYAVSHNLGDVISMSFGESDQCLGTALTKAWHDGFVNATKKGITLFASSGDQGASQPSCDGTTWIQSTSSPASDPLVTGVGGTELIASGWDPCSAPRTTSSCNPTGGMTPGTWLSETTWNEGPTGDFANVFGTTEATGGGYSTVWHEPAYQEGTIHGGKTRAVPDVAYNAAILHGVLVPLAEFGGVFRFGGTSCGSPQWAAITAIFDQAAGHDFGFINAALYKVGQSAPSYAASFHDITVGQNNALEADGNGNPVAIAGYNAGTGWDAVTGLGSPSSSASLLAQMGQVWSAGQGNAAISNSKNG